eukprot:TRINITY_DN12411_c0_g1_i2.p1 TRINITY_DN12411_c0_g1~~TRINITY_DN12411_c0_g1_i2.p1  ORF type:complete len:535 (-),score=76.98 TRINITY_DN12411_c0_g1_i2:180-1715(-)
MAFRVIFCVFLGLLCSCASASQDMELGQIKQHLSGHLRVIGRHIEAVSAEQERSQLSQVSQVSSQSEATKTWFGTTRRASFTETIAICLILFSISFLWVHEWRIARQESVLLCGESGFQSFHGQSVVQASKSGVLVHLSGLEATAAGTLKDSNFEDLNWDKCLRMRRTVEAYQWVKQKNTVGSTDPYSHTKQWKARKMNSDDFPESEEQKDLAVRELEPGVTTQNNTDVRYGPCHVVPSDLLDQLSEFRDATQLGNSVAISRLLFHKSGDWYYHPARGSDEETQVGDMRVRFECIPEVPVTILALNYRESQRQSPSYSFLPYRLVWQGFFGGLDEKALQTSLIAEGRKTDEELDSESGYTGYLAILCACCNLVSLSFASLATPQIFEMHLGEVTDPKESFEKLSSKVLKVLGVRRRRLLGWILLDIGIIALLLAQPLSVASAGLFIAQHSGLGVKLAMCIVSFMVTAFIATLLVSLAHFIYQPLRGLLFLLLAATIAAVPVVMACLSHHAR